MRTVESGGTQSSVARAEFQALLDGLRIIDETCVEMTKAMRLFDTRIYWVADREDLVLSVARNLEKENMPTLYGRKTNSDLWRAFSYYEERFQITPVHFPKSAVPLWFTRLDERSTEIRTMFLEHAETWAEMDAELQMMGYPWKAPAKFKALVTDADYIKSTTSDVTFTEWMSQKMAEHTPDVMRLVSAFMVGDLREEDHNGTCRIMPALP